MNEPKAIKWTFNGKEHHAAIGGGLLALYAYPIHGLWGVRIFGVSGKQQHERFETANEAKLWAEHRASVYVKQMAEELQASFMSAESEASDG